MTATDFYLEYAKARQTELQDIAAMDRLAAELAPRSALQRWARQRRTGQATPPDAGGGSAGGSAPTDSTTPDD